MYGSHAAGQIVLEVKPFFFSFLILNSKRAVIKSMSRSSIFVFLLLGVIAFFLSDLFCNSQNDTRPLQKAEKFISKRKKQNLKPKNLVL